MYHTARRPRSRQPTTTIISTSTDIGGRTHFATYCSIDAWTPAVNAYALEDRLEVCVDLAGVDRRSIEVRVEPGKLIIRGTRSAPQPHCPSDQSMQILMMEIDHGPFERTLRISNRIATDRITAEQRNGLLWIHLPFAE